MGKVLMFGVITFVLLSLVAPHLGVGITDDGLTVDKAYPTEGYDVVTTGLEWIADALTFQLTDMPALIGSLLWLFILMTIFVPVIYLIRGIS